MILGATGLLGHKTLEVLARRYSVVGTCRQESTRQTSNIHSIIPGVDAHAFESVVRIVNEVRPTVIVNCVGIVKSRVSVLGAAMTERVNGDFPLQLADLCSNEGIRLIHISTDCVFSGTRGQYSESDTPDPIDLYGHSKLRGEPSAPGCLTLRTSFIGRETGTPQGLVEWLCSQRGGNVRGFRRTRFSGVTTPVLARLIADLIELPPLDGLWHVAADPIDKCSLLGLLNEALNLRITVEPDDSVVCDRSLNGAAFRARTSFVAPSWPEMVAELAQDSRVYEQRNL